uniref:Uncharacterized protein n=1 Tax=Magnetococcus massalia (strain MO-1) TaxID=451514 RepID=A0A1S7LHC9_MAGMO|nr:conserved protein of unknown function [Candidatus Magnetococcus massalia]
MAQITSHKLSVHHFGEPSRLSFPFVPAFPGDVQSVYYSSGESAALASLSRRVHSAPHYDETYVVPACIAAHNEEVVSANGGEEETLCLELNPPRLDSFLADPASPVAAPTLLSIAQQGITHEILSSAQRALSRNVVAVVAEVWFIAVPGQTKRYQEVAELLSESGFTVQNLEALPAAASATSILGSAIPDQLSGAGQALFFKKPESIIRDHAHASLDLLKAALLAILYNRMDLAQDYLDHFDTLGGWAMAGPAAQQVDYIHFLARWRQAAQEGGVQWHVEEDLLALPLEGEESQQMPYEVMKLLKEFGLAALGEANQTQA